MSTIPPAIALEVKDLTQVPPRSPKIRLAGFAILARTIDKCRSHLWGNVGEYHFDCPLDNVLFSFKGITGAEFKAFVEAGHTDDEIAAWVKASGTPRTDEEITAWSDKQTANNYTDNPAKADTMKWLQESNSKLGLPVEATLFDMLDADDIASYKK